MTDNHRKVLDQCINTLISTNKYKYTITINEYALN